MISKKRMITVTALGLMLVVTGCGGLQNSGQPPKPAPVPADSTSSDPTKPAPPTSKPTPPSTANPSPPSTANPTPPSTTNPMPPATTNPTPTPPTSTPPAPKPAPLPEGPLAFTEVARGQYSGITERKVVLFQDEATWSKHWQLHGQQTVPAPTTPQVNFAKESIIAVYMGEKNTGGYSVEIKRVSFSGGKLKVTVQERTPGPGSMTTMALTQPFHLIRVPVIPGSVPVEVTWQ